MAIRVHDSMNEVLLRRSLEYNMEDGTGVCYSCNVGCEEGFVKNGFPEELARMRINPAVTGRRSPVWNILCQDVTRINHAHGSVSGHGKR